MPADAARVLEIGCGEGALGAAYLRRNPTCRYVGVECHAPSAAIARGRLPEVIAANAETLDDAGGPFDLVVLGDVLEHFADPEAMLDRLRGWMAPGAHLVACVPNIAHWSALAEVMAGRWPVASAGLFDRTHRRFFTQDSLLALLRAQSFRPIRCRPRNFGGVEAERVMPP